MAWAVSLTLAFPSIRANRAADGWSSEDAPIMLMKTLKIEVYTFDELNDDAKEKARDWYRPIAFDGDWWDGIYEDAKQIGLELSSFDLDRNRHAKGKLLKDATEVADLVLKNHGDECETYKTAEAFLRDRDEIVNTAPKDEHGEFENERALDAKLDECEADFLRSLLEDYSIILQKESEYLSSDEHVDEMIRINEYTFTADGKRMG